MKQRLCSNCHSPLDEDSMFCMNCGQPVKEDEPASGAVCPQCGQPLEEGNQFCEYCGAAVPAQSKEVLINQVLPVIDESETAPIALEKKQENICPECGRPYLDGDTFCMGCGCRLGNASEEGTKPESVEQQTDNTAISDNASDKEEIPVLPEAEKEEQSSRITEAVRGKICPKCGEINDDEDVFCLSCGYHFQEMTEPETVISDEPSGRICPVCGTMNDPDDTFCLNCGARFEAEPADKPAEDTKNPAVENVSTEAEPLMQSINEEETAEDEIEEKTDAPEDCVCPVCNKSVPAAFSFCPYCGSRMINEEKAEEDQKSENESVSESSDYDRSDSAEYQAEAKEAETIPAERMDVNADAEEKQPSDAETESSEPEEPEEKDLLESNTLFASEVFASLEEENNSETADDSVPEKTELIETGASPISEEYAPREEDNETENEHACVSAYEQHTDETEGNSEECSVPDDIAEQPVKFEEASDLTEDAPDTLPYESFVENEQEDSVPTEEEIITAEIMPEELNDTEADEYGNQDAEVIPSPSVPVQDYAQPDRVNESAKSEGLGFPEEIYCLFCGKKIPSYSIFCLYCGSELRKNPNRAD